MNDLLLILSLCLKVLTLYFAAVALFALKPRKSFPKAPPRTRFAVVTAARNEEAVIAQLVNNILAQDYPAHLRDVFVIPNNCTDRTAALALAAGAEVISCPPEVQGKGTALRVAFDKLKSRGYDAYLVLDADNTFAPDYLARMNDAITAGAGVAKSRTVAANPTAAGVAGCYGLYNTCFDLLWSLPRANCGLSAKLIGTGFAVTADTLDKLGGWNTVTIAEDAEFAAQCARAGIRVEWVPEAVNYDEEPVSFLLSLRQRKRWCSGVMQVARQELVHLWRQAVPRPALRRDMTAFLLAPFSQAISGLLLLGTVLSSLTAGNWEGLCLAGAAYLLGGIVLAAALSAAGGYGLKGMVPAILLFPLFMATWLPLQILSLFHDTKTWHAISHTGTPAPAGQCDCNPSVECGTMGTALANSKGDRFHGKLGRTEGELSLLPQMCPCGHPHQRGVRRGPHGCGDPAGGGRPRRAGGSHR